MTSAPITPSTLRVSACAHTAPKRPVEAPITAMGLPRSELSGKGREAQSSAFLSTPGIDPLYSGVAITSPSAPAIASRSLATAGCAGSTSWSESYGGSPGGLDARLQVEADDIGAHHVLAGGEAAGRGHRLGDAPDRQLAVERDAAVVCEADVAGAERHRRRLGRVEELRREQMLLQLRDC